jgi:hypothetical protein
MPKKIRPWIELVWKMCPVSSVPDSWLYWLQDRNSMHNWYTINHPTTLHAYNETQWPTAVHCTAARRWDFGFKIELKCWIKSKIFDKTTYLWFHNCMNFYVVNFWYSLWFLRLVEKMIAICVLWYRIGSKCYWLEWVDP